MSGHMGPGSDPHGACWRRGAYSKGGVSPWFPSLISVSFVAGLASVERERLRAIVEADVDALDRTHAAGFLLCTPGGAVWDRKYYLGGLADGSIRYLRFEPQGEIQAVETDGAGALRWGLALPVGHRHRHPWPARRPP